MSKELTSLRVSVARLAQVLKVDNALQVTGKTYEQLVELAETKERGWNGLVLECIEYIENYEDPNDYVGMGWVDDRGRP